MTSKHTPGPWLVVGKSTIRSKEYRVLVARAHWFNGEHNARLIAAAPDLLAALKEVARLIDHGHVMTAATEARAAIAKAGGQS